MGSISFNPYRKATAQEVTDLKFQSSSGDTRFFLGGALRRKMCFYRGQKSQKINKNGSFMPFSSKVGQLGVEE